MLASALRGTPWAYSAHLHCGADGLTRPRALWRRRWRCGRICYHHNITSCTTLATHLPRCDKRLQRGRCRPATYRAVLRQAVHRRPDGGQRNHREHVRMPAAVRRISTTCPPSSVGASRGPAAAAAAGSAIGRQHADVAVIASQPQCATDQAGAEHAVPQILPPQQPVCMCEQV